MKKSSSPWLFSAPVDLLIGCGGWSLPLIFLTVWATNADAALLASAFYFLTVFCNNPHYMATIYRAYGSGADFKKHRFFTVYVTVLLVVTVTIVHLFPAIFPWVLTLYLLWSPWHYSGQNFGVAMLLARRAGAQPDPQARQYLFLSYIVSYAVWVIAVQAIDTPDPGLIVFRIPPEFTRLLLPFLSASFVVFTVAALLRIGRAFGSKSIVAPALLSFSQGLWFIAPTLLQHYRNVELPAAYYSAGVLAFMHCAQYLWVTSFYARREAEQTQPAVEAQKFQFTRYYITLIIGGLVLFIPGPWIASRILGHEFVESFLIFAALVNLHHFILDGAIWKLRDGRIARILLGRGSPPEASAENAITGGFPKIFGWLGGKSLAGRALRYGLIACIAGLAVADQIQFQVSKKEAGADGLRQAETLNPRDSRVYFHRAQLLFAQGQTNAARVELEKAIAVNPRSAPPQQLLGEILFKSGDVAAARAHYDQMAERFPPNIVVTMNRALLAQQAGDSKQSIALFRQALTLAPRRIQLHYLLAHALETSGDRDGAIIEYARYIDLYTANGVPEEKALYAEAARKVSEFAKSRPSSSPR